MVTAQDVLERHFPGLSPDEVDAELSRTPAAEAAPISASALEYLTQHGGEEAAAVLEGYDPARIDHAQAVAAAQDLQDTLRSSLTPEEAAAELGVSRSRISHRLSARSLYAFHVQGRRYLPRWQFQAKADGPGSEPIPGLAQIVPAIPRDMHPLAMEVFMTTSLVDLDDRSPRQHLCSLGTSGTIADWLGALSHR